MLRVRELESGEIRAAKLFRMFKHNQGQRDAIKNEMQILKTLVSNEGNNQR